ncbi:MAG TPA: putative baseplate assembly protein [Allosphingosinicella sp.]|jgi:hypothetical protein
MTGTDTKAAGSLSRGIGSSDTLLGGMQRAAKVTPPLTTLNLHNEGDFTNALMSGWARVCDVLSFYQDRIANEGYLATAVEPASILWLAAEIGEGARPAVGAQVHLALQLIDAPGQARSILLDPGPSLTVQNAPGASDVLPVVFEGAERRELRPSWNALAPVIAPVLKPAEIWPGCRSLRLVGTSLGIKPGGALLLHGEAGRSWLAIADTVQADPAQGCTLVTWRDPAPAASTIASVTQFERTAGLFGRTAMRWDEVSEKQKQAIGVCAGGVMLLDQRGLTGAPRLTGPGLWARPRAASPPPPRIQALLGLDGAALLAGTDRGVQRSGDGGATWQALTLPQPNGWHDVLSLHRDGAGILYAGTEAGVVLSSADGGDSWAIMTRIVLPDAANGGPVRTILADLHLRDAAKAPPPWTLGSPIRAIASHADPRALPTLVIGTDQGLFTLAAGAAAWKPFNGGFPTGNKDGRAADVAVFGLAVLDGSWLLAATSRGAYWTGIDKARWAPLPLDGLPSGAECSSVETSAGIAFFGTSRGVVSFRRRTAKAGGLEPVQAWPMAPIFALAATGVTLYAATAQGIQTLQETDPEALRYGDHWEPLDVQDLTLFELDTVFAPAGDSGPVTDALRDRFERFGITLVKDVEVRKIFFRTSQSGSGVGWELREAPPSARIFRIYHERPLRITQLVQNRASPADRIVATDQGPVASVPLGPVLNREWPDFAIGTDETSGETGVAGAEIYLDRTVEGIAAGSLLVLAPAGAGLIPNASGAPPPEVHKVIASESILHKAFGRQRVVTRIVVRQTQALLATDPRTVTVHLASRPVAPFGAAAPAFAAVGGNRLTLPGVHGDLRPGHALQVSGPRAGAVVVPPDDEKEELVAQAGAEASPALDQQMISPALTAAFSAAGIKLSPAASVSMVLRGAVWLVRDGDRVWQLRLGSDPAGPLPLGIYRAALCEVIAAPEGALAAPHSADPQGRLPGEPWRLQCGDTELTSPEGSVLWQRAASTQQSFSEIAIIGSVATDPAANATLVTLKAPLRRLYDNARCRICANVVLATQGETVSGEVLGSGRLDGAGQSFTLHRSPLTYTQDRTGYEVHSELEVRVDGEGGRALRFGGGAAPAAPAGQHWRETRSLALAGPAERAFALSTDEAGRATLFFGDGTHGARLPPGSNNVTARYRAGAGAGGNVGAGALIVLRKRPPGIRSVTNPDPAVGGRNAEPVSELRRRAPRKFDCCDRIVTLADYGAFARAVAGIGRAQAALLNARVWLTLATADGRPISEAPELRLAVREEIERRRADRLELLLADPKVVRFNVALRIDLHPGGDPVHVRRQVIASLALAFSRAARGFAMPVDIQAIQEAASAVAGVAASTVTSLYRTRDPEALHDRLDAAPARFDAGEDEQAEWLIVNALGGICVTVANG